MVILNKILELPEGSLTRRRGRREYAGEGIARATTKRPRICLQTAGQSSSGHHKKSSLVEVFFMVECFVP